MTSSHNICTLPMKLFQRDEPLVHILYDKVNEVTCICFCMFLKTEVVAEKVGNELKAIDCEKSENWLPSKKNWKWNEAVGVRLAR